MFCRDDVWFTKRKPDCHFDMFPSCSFADKGEDMKDYLLGKFYGIPNVMRFMLEE